MTVENASFIPQLNQEFPQPKDLLKEGDDHIRLVKKVLRNCFPKIDKGLDATADWVNSLFKILKPGSGSLSLEKTQLKNLADGSDAQDAVTMKQLTDKINSALKDNIYRVGALYITEENINPANIPMFAGTTWARWGTGRALVGVGAATDSNNERQEYGLGTVGTFNAYIDKGHLPAITLAVGGQTDDQGWHTHTMSGNVMKYSGSNHIGQGSNTIRPTNDQTDGAGNHRHNLNGRTEQLGNRAALNNVQPSQTAYIWKRTA